jgi:hypothetical protein
MERSWLNHKRSDGNRGDPRQFLSCILEYCRESSDKTTSAGPLIGFTQIRGYIVSPNSIGLVPLSVEYRSDSIRPLEAGKTIKQA